MSKMTLLMCCVFFCVIWGQAVAQDAKVPVFVRHTGSDRVGIAVAYELKEALRGSHSFRLTDTEEKPHIKVAIVSVDESSSNDEGISSALAYALLFDSKQTPVGGSYITVAVKTCGRAAVQRCARDILPNIDQGVVFLRENYPNLYKQLC